MSQFSNPITSDGLRADPFILRFNGRYYLYCTNEQLICWSSSDLVNWTEEGPVVAPGEFGSLVPFAPEVIYINGIFYLYTSPSGKGHYVLQGDNPLGPFKTMSTGLKRSLDASPFLDDDGTLYLFWADDRGILGCRMESPDTPGETVLVCPTDIGWTEGPQVIKEGVNYYLTYCGTHYLAAGYRVYGAVGDTPLGPFSYQFEKPLIISTEGQYVGLGHCSTVWGPDLLVRYIAYHNLNKNRSRDLNLAPICFEENKITIAGPCTYLQDCPGQPCFISRAQENDWIGTTGKVQQHEKDFLIAYGNVKVESRKVFNLTSYALEFNLSSKGYPFGVFVGDIQILLISCDEIHVYHGENLLHVSPLPCTIQGEALHSIMIKNDQSGLNIFLDGLLVAVLTRALPQSRRIGYVGFGDWLIIGHTQIAMGDQKAAFDEIAVPIPAELTISNEMKINAPDAGTYLIHMLTPEGALDGCEIQVNDCHMVSIGNRDSSEIVLQSGLNVLTTLNASQQTNSRLIIHPKTPPMEDSLVLEPTGSYGKVTLGYRYTSSCELIADFHRNQLAPGGCFGVIFRATQCSEGGEGDDRVLGINSFIGYSFMISAHELILSKHHYDQKILIKTRSSLYLGNMINIRVLARESTIKIFLNKEDEPAIIYQDPDPLFYGRGGIRYAAALLDRAVISFSSID